MELLTEDEREALRLSGELANLLRRIVGPGPNADGDWDELARQVHGIQNAVMSQAAARAYPGRFRLLGKTIDRLARHEDAGRVTSGGG